MSAIAARPGRAPGRTAAGAVEELPRDRRVVIHPDETSAVEPLGPVGGCRRGEPRDSYLSGV